MSFQDRQAQFEPGPQSSPEYPEYSALLYTVLVSFLIPPESSPGDCPKGVVRGPCPFPPDWPVAYADAQFPD